MHIITIQIHYVEMNTNISSVFKSRYKNKRKESYYISQVTSNFNFFRIEKHMPKWLSVG